MNKRIKNKLIKKSIIITDVSSIPNGWDLKHWKKAVDMGVVFWDSNNKGIEPKIYPRVNTKVFKFINK